MSTENSVRVYRGDYIESTHDIHIAIVKNGKLFAYHGDPYRLTFARSSMKPLQALAVVLSNALEVYDISEKELALICSSHNGEPKHRESVANILEKLNLKESSLQCGTHIPRDKESYKELIKNGEELTPIYSNCSGKHSGMLAGCKAQNMDIDTYREISHPYQQQIIDFIYTISGYTDKIATSTDGCGVPVHRLPLNRVALAFSRLASPNQWQEENQKVKDALIRIRNAMVNYPDMVAGKGRFDTDLMKAYKKQFVAKSGAEGVHCFGNQQSGIGVAIKVEDGNERGAHAAAMEVLKQLGFVDEKTEEQLSDYSHPPIFNTREEKIGEVNTSFQLKYVSE